MYRRPVPGAPQAHHAVRKAQKRDVGALAGMLARAFEDDPLTTWMVPRRAGLPRLFRGLLRPALALDEVYTTEALDGAAFWNPPGTFPLGGWANARMGLTMAGLLGWRLPSRTPGLLYFDRHHPRAPHWYLQILGTEPARQGGGVATALLAPVLERCDRDGLPVYLEASKERNVPFYARFGFTVTDEMHVPGGPPLWAMWREPR